MLNKIDTSKWQYYNVGLLFKPKNKIKRFSATPESEGLTPFITSSSVNNGVTALVDEEPVASNVITVSTNGACFDCFYHDDSIAISSDVDILTNDKLNKYNALFICTVLKLEKIKFSYGRKPKNGKVYKTNIKLPYLTKDEPDWDYMTEFVRKLWGGSHKTSIPSSKINLDINNWKEFKLSDIFNIKYGINMELCDLEVDNSNEGINFVSRTESNNGVSARVTLVNGKIPQESGLITVAGGGSVLSTFLQPKSFYSGRDLYIMKAKDNISDLSKLFLCTLIKKNKYKYNYGRQANTTLTDIIIKLPVDQNQNIDWEFIDNFMKKIPYSDKV